MWFFWYCVVICHLILCNEISNVKIWKICITQWSHNFSKWPVPKVIKPYMSKTFSGREDRPMDFNVTEYKSSPIWFQLPNRDLPPSNYNLLSFGKVSKNVQLSEQAIKTLPVLTVYLWGLIFFTYISQNNSTTV